MFDMLYHNYLWVIKRPIALLLAGGIFVYSQLAQAHPHSFIDMDATFVSDKQMLVGMKMVWTMDEITSADLLYDAENAKSDSEIWKKLAAEVMANVLGQHYFTDIYRNGKPVKYKNLPTEYQLSRKGHQAVLEFVLPLAEPQPLAGKPFIISTYDPTYFVDMSYDHNSDAKLPETLARQCKISVKTPKPTEDMQAFALSLDKADAPPEDMELGKQFAQQVILQCQ